MSSKKHNSPDLLIKCGLLLTMTPDANVLHDVEVEVAEGTIRAIRPLPSKSDMGDVSSRTLILDASRDLVMPGLVNCHNHAAMTLFRGLADDLPLKVWLFEKIFPAEAEYLTSETVYWGALLGCAEMIASGTTCFADGYFFEESVVDAVHQSGLRALLAQGIIDFPAPGVPDPAKKFHVGRRFIKQHQNVSHLITPSLFCHSPATCSEDTLKKAKEICEEFDVPLQIHLCETLDEVSGIKGRVGKSPVELLEHLGLLGADLIAAHAVHLEADDIKTLKSRKVRVVHVPESNMKLASGMAKVTTMIELGMKPALGTDGCASNNNLDMFGEMDMAAKLAKIVTGNPEAMPAKTVLKMGTLWGAEALGMEEDIGSIEVGKKADMVVIDLDQPHLQPLHDPFSTVVYSANGGDVKHVLVNGKLLYENRCFTSLDIEKVMWHIKKICSNMTIQNRLFNDRQGNACLPCGARQGMFPERRHFSPGAG